MTTDGEEGAYHPWGGGEPTAHGEEGGSLLSLLPRGGGEPTEPTAQGRRGGAYCPGEEGGSLLPRGAYRPWR